MTTSSHSDNPLPPPNIWTDPPPPDLATIVTKCGDLGIKAIAAMANVSEDDVRRALANDQARLDDIARLVADANAQADGRRRAGEGLRHILGLLGMPRETPLVTVDDAERLAAALLAELWARRDDVEWSPCAAIEPSTVTVQVLTSADIERLTRFLYWLTSSVGWLDVRSIIADSADDAMTSPGAEALARELVAELLRKNGGDHGLG